MPAKIRNYWCTYTVNGAEYTVTVRVCCEHDARMIFMADYAPNDPSFRGNLKKNLKIKAC